MLQSAHHARSHYAPARTPARRRPTLMLGKPPINKPAEGPAPMLELSLADRAVLARIRKAGAEGVAIGDDLTVSQAIRLGLVGLVTIDKKTPQRVRYARVVR